MAETLRYDVLGKGDASDLAKVAAALEALTAKLTKLDRTKAEPTVEVDTRKADAQVGKFASDLQKRIGAAVKAIPDIKVGADSSDAETEIAALRAELVALSDQTIGVDVDATLAQAQIERISARLAELSRDSADVQVTADTAAAAAALGYVDKQLDEIDGRVATAKVKVETDKSLADSVIQVAALGRALGSIALPVALVAATPAVAALGGAVLSTAGALPVLGAAGGAAAFGMGALTVATSGFAEALEEVRDPEKFAEAIKDLAPAAQETAVAVRDMVPAWDELKKRVQDRFFRGLAEDARDLGRTYLPIVEAGFTRVAAVGNTVVRSVSDLLQTTERVGDSRRMVDAFGTAWANVGGAVTPLVGALLDVGVVGAEVLADVTSGAGDAAREFAAMVREARETGRLEEWIRRGVDQVKQLGRITGDVGGILTGVFGAAEDAGAGFFDVVERITSKIDEWVNSTAGQAAIVDFFTTIRETGEAAWPGIERLIGAVGNLWTELSRAEIPQKFGELISDVADAVADLVEFLTPLVTTVLPPLLDGLGAAAPLLVPLVAGLLALKAAGKGLGFLRGLADDVLLLGGRLKGLGGKFDEVDGKARKARGGLGFFRAGLLLLAADMVTGGYLSDAIDEYTTYIRSVIDALAGDQAAAQRVAEHGFTQFAVRTGSRVALEAVKLGQNLAAPILKFTATAASFSRDFAGGLLKTGAEVQGFVVRTGASLAGIATGAARALVPSGLVGTIARWVAGADAPAAQAGNAVYVALAGAIGRVAGIPPISILVEASVDNALSNISSALNAAQSQAVLIAIAGDPAPINGVIASVRALAAATVANMGLGADNSPAIAAIDAAVAYGTNAVSMMRHGADTGAALGQIGAAVAAGNAATSIGTHAANNGPAVAAINAATAIGMGSSSTGTHNANTAPAIGAINGARAWGNAAHSQSTHTVIANTAAARSAIAGLRVGTSSTHTVYVRTVGGGAALGARLGAGAGGGLVGYAAGGLVPRWQRFDRGGVIPGYEPGVDRVPAILSRGEAVLVPELVRAIGPQNILRANWAASRRKPTFFAAGGIVPPPNDDSFASNSYYSPNRGRPGAVQAEDGSWVMPSFYSRTAGPAGKVQAEDGTWVPRSFYGGGPIAIGAVRMSIRAMADGGMVGAAARGRWPRRAMWSYTLPRRAGSGMVNLDALLGELRGMRAALRDALGDATLAAEIRGQTRALVAALRTVEGAHSASQRGLVAAEMGWR